MPKSYTNDPYLMDLLNGDRLGLATSLSMHVPMLVDDVQGELHIFEEWESEGRVDGILSTDLEAEDPRSALLRQLGIPTSAVASPQEELAESARPDACASAHDVVGVNAILSHLHDTGHRRIGWIAGPSEFVASRRRVDVLERWRPEFDVVACTHASLDPSAISR